MTMWTATTAARVVVLIAETQVKQATEEPPKVALAADYHGRSESYDSWESNANGLSIVDFPRLKTDVESYSALFNRARGSLLPVAPSPTRTCKHNHTREK
jgi:hypothetical protein